MKTIIYSDKDANEIQNIIDNLGYDESIAVVLGHDTYKITGIGIAGYHITGEKLYGSIFGDKVKLCDYGELKIKRGEYIIAYLR